MKVTNVEKKENNTVELTIHVDADLFEGAVQQAYLKNRNKITVPGFRKGKATRKLIEGMFGSGFFYEEAINALYPTAYEAAVERQGLDAVGYPEINVTDVSTEAGLTFTALVTLRPEAKLSQYKGLTAPKAEPTVTEEDIENELKPFITRATRLVSVERAVQNGDTAVIDFEGFDNGTAFEGGKGENYELEIGSGSFVPGFEEQIVGMAIGEEKEINITFPENYHADLAGKPVVFKVKVNEVKEHQVPALDAEFAKDVSEFETLAELKKDLGDKLLERRQEDAQNNFENAIMAQLIDNMEVEIPEVMIEAQLNRVMDDFAMRLQSNGLTMENYAAMMGGNIETVRASARPAAKRQVEMELAMTAIAKAENFQITDEEIEAELQKMSEEYKLEVEKLKAYITIEDLKKDMCLRKASDLVLAEAKVGEAPVKEEAAEEAPKKKRATRKKKTEETEAPAAE